jgi:hypothetical protein
VVGAVVPAWAAEVGELGPFRIDPARVEEASVPVISTPKAKILTADIANLLFVALGESPSWRTLPRRRSAVLIELSESDESSDGRGRIVRFNRLGRGL